jgi:hypothetical protein
MWRNVPSLGWTSMIVKPQPTYTALRCRGAWLSGAYVFVPALMVAAVGTLAGIDAASNFEAVQAGESRTSDAVLRSYGNPWFLAALGAYVAAICGRFWLGNPEVRVDADGLTIQNLWRTTRVAWRDVERIDLAGYAGITIKTRDQEILCAGLRCSAVEWLPLGRESRLRARGELGLIRDWLDQHRATALMGTTPTHDRP